MIKLILIFTASTLLIGCGSKKDEPLVLSEYNEKCLNGKVKGQFLVQYSNGSHEVVSASSKEDFYKKILSEENQNLLAKRNLEISAVDFNFRVKLKSTTSLDDAPSTDANLGPRILNAPFLWNQGFYGQGSKTALIDSGYDINHPLLQNSLLETTDEIGWDFINEKPLTGDLGTHGTIVGSVIAAAHTDDFQFSMAPGSKMIPIAALQPADEGETDASGDSNTIISALDYAISKGVDFINASWAGDVCSKFIRIKVEEATKAGIIVVTSAGNENVNLDEQPIFPGSFPFSLLVNVGALNPDLSRQVDSNYGSDVDFFALGSRVVVAAPHKFLSTASGTSVATPFITGGLALLKSAFPNTAPEALLNALNKSKNSKKIPDLKRAFFDLKTP